MLTRTNFQTPERDRSKCICDEELDLNVRPDCIVVAYTT